MSKAYQSDYNHLELHLKIKWEMEICSYDASSPPFDGMIFTSKPKI